MNVITDSLNQKTMSIGNLAFISISKWPLVLNIQFLANMMIQLDNLDKDFW